MWNHDFKPHKRISSVYEKKNELKMAEVRLVLKLGTGSHVYLHSGSSKQKNVHIKIAATFHIRMNGRHHRNNAVKAMTK